MAFVDGPSLHVLHPDVWNAVADVFFGHQDSIAYVALTRARRSVRRV